MIFLALVAMEGLFSVGFSLRGFLMTYQGLEAPVAVDVTEEGKVIFKTHFLTFSKKIAQ